MPTAVTAHSAPPAGEVAEVVAMLDALAAADVRITISDLEDLLARLRPAMAVRHRLSTVSAATLRAALTARASRGATLEGQGAR